MSRLTMSAGVLATGALLMAGIGGAQASDVIDTYQLTACSNSSGNLCTQSAGSSYGTVSLNLTNSTITFTLNSGYLIEDPSSESSLGFNAQSTTSINTPYPFGWSSTSQTSVDGNTVFGTYLLDLACTSDDGNCGTSVTLSLSNLTGGLTANADGYLAELDVCINDGEGFCDSEELPNNGIVAAGAAATPLPAALPLFGTVLGAGFLGLRRRLRKATGSVAA